MNKKTKNRRKNMVSVKVIIVLAGLLLMTTVVNAGNISPGKSNSATTGLTATGDITLPVEGIKYDSTVPIEYVVSGDVQFVLDGDNIDPPGSGTNITLSKGSHTLAVIHVDSGETLDMVNFTVDTDAPGDVSGLTASTVTENSITWSWSNPGDNDLANIIVTVVKVSDSSVIVPDTNLGLVETYQATGLDADTEYKITVKTEDDAVS